MAGLAAVIQAQTGLKPLNSAYCFEVLDGSVLERSFLVQVFIDVLRLGGLT